MAEDMTDVQSTDDQGTEGTAGTPAAQTEPEKTYTQSEVNDIIAHRLAREAKKYPSKDEMAEYRRWRAANESEGDRLSALTRERDEAAQKLRSAEKELDDLKHEKYLIGLGVPAEDADYYAYRIGQAVTDQVSFEMAAKDYLKAHPPQKQTGARETVRVDTAAPTGGGSSAGTANETMNSLIRRARR